MVTLRKEGRGDPDPPVHSSPLHLHDTNPLKVGAQEQPVTRVGQGMKGALPGAEKPAQAWEIGCVTDVVLFFFNLRET